VSLSQEIVRWVSVPATEDDVQLMEICVRSRCRTSSARREYCDSDLVDLHALAAAAPPDPAYLAVVVADAQYATIPWDCPWPASWLHESCRG